MTTYTLNPFEPSSIDSLISALQGVKAGLPEMTNRILQDAVDYGVETARSELASISSGELLNSVVGRVADGKGEIEVTARHGALVEFGTGPYGLSGPQHPELPEGWDYRPDSWVYLHPEYGYLTSYGMASRPFFYHTLRRLSDYLESRGASS